MTLKYRDDPIGWIETYIDFTGLEHQGLTDQQKLICKALVKDKKLCIAAGGGIGKSALVAMLILWFLITHPGARIPTTAPSHKQLIDVLFGEISKWLNRCQLKSFYRLLSSKLYIAGHTEWYAVARTVPKDNRLVNGTLAGFHSESLLIVVDEAADVPDGVYTALDGAMTTKNCYIILISNPVSTGGYFYDTITDPAGRGAGFKVMNLSCIDSPLVSENYIKQIIARYGKDSPMYRSKVLGESISITDNIVVDPKLFDEVVSFQRERHGGKVVLGIDVGGMVDPTIICHRIGDSFVRWDEYDKVDEDFMVPEILGMIDRLYKGEDVCVVIDAIGEGAGLARLLSNRAIGFELIEHKGSKASERPDMYRNQRTERYHLFKKHFRNFHFPVKPPERLKKELANLLFVLGDGPMEMEPKKRFHNRLGFSPDYADAASMTEMADSYKQKIYVQMPNTVGVNILGMLTVTNEEGMFL
jgi:hypothetical protein